MCGNVRGGRNAKVRKMFCGIGDSNRHNIIVIVQVTKKKGVSRQTHHHCAVAPRLTLCLAHDPGLADDSDPCERRLRGSTGRGEGRWVYFGRLAGEHMSVLYISPRDSHGAVY